jgi:hypothetical protein
MVCLNFCLSTRRATGVPRFRSTCSSSSTIGCRLSVSGAQAYVTRGGTHSVANRSRCNAQAVSSPAEAKAWWKAYPHLWEEVQSRAEFEEAIQDSDYEVVLVGALPGQLGGTMR